MPAHDQANTVGLNSSIARIRARLGPSHIALTPVLPKTPSSSYHNAHVTRSLGKGREVTTNAVLGTGTQLLVEEPYVHEIGTWWIGRVCSYCFGGTAIVRCRECKHHRYCSNVCRSYDWTRGYHSVLCSLYDVLNEDQILAIKAYLRSCASDITTQLCFNSFAHIQIPRLASNLSDMPETDIQSYTSSASFCAQALYLPTSSIKSLVTILAQIRCNRFAVKANTKSQSAGIVEHVDEKLGSAIYLQASMLNHSCQPNAFVSFNGLQITVLCSAGIVKDEEVTISYGPLVSRHSRLDRQRELKEKYLFQCQCIACCEGHSTQSLMYKCTSGCETDTIQHRVQTCPSCGEKINWAQINKIENRVNQIKGGRCTLEQLKRVLKLQQTIYSSDALPIGSTYDNIAASLANGGHFAEAAVYCSHSLDIVQKQYGVESLESADEQFKLATLLFNAMKSKEAYSAVLDCIHIFRKLGLHRVRRDDMEELVGMRQALENSKGHW